MASEPNNELPSPELERTEDGDPIIDLSVSPTGETTFDYDDAAPNLVAAFAAHPDGQKALEKIADRVLEDFDADWENQAPYRAKVKANIKILSGDLPPKSWPFQNCANAHLPIMLENITRLSCRIESEIFGDWTNVFGAMPVGPMDDDFAEIVSTHGNWQIREQIVDFERQMQRGLLMFMAIGDVTFHSYWDPGTRLNVHEALTPDQFVVPFTYVSTRPDLGDLPHYTQVLRYYRHQIQAYEGRWEGIDEVLEKAPTSWDDDPETPVRQGMAETMGESVPTSEPSDELSNGAPYVLLQYEGWMRLPNQKKDRWVQVIADYRTRRIVSLRIHEEPNWQDKLRFEREVAEVDMYRQAKAANDQMQAEFAGHKAKIQEGVDTGEMTPMAIDQAHAALEPFRPPPPPIPPKWMVDPNDPNAMPEEPRKDPILLYAHGVCLEPLTGVLGLSPGHLLADYNRAGNTILSQFIDQATLANAGGIIAPDTLEFERPFVWSPGKVTKVKGLSGVELKNSIMPFQAPAANPQMFQLISLLTELGSSAAQAPDVLSGEAGKSGETYRGIATRIEQATKQLSIVGRRFAQIVKRVLQNNAKLNSIFLPDEEIFRVTQGVAMTAMPPIRVTRAMYQRDYRIEIRADLQFSSAAAKIAEADQILQMGMSMPPLAQNIAFIQQAIKRSLVARHRQDMVVYLGPELPPPQTPLGIIPTTPPGAVAPGAQGSAPNPPAPSGGPQPAPPPQAPPAGGQVVHPQGPGGPVQTAA